MARPTRRFMTIFLLIGFACAGAPAYFGIYDSFSVQSLWTVTATVSLVVGLWTSRADIPRTINFLWVISIIFLLFHSFYALFTDQSLTAYSYIFAFPLTVGGFALGSSTDLGGDWGKNFYRCAVVTCFVAPIFAMLGIVGDLRVLQATLAFAVIIISTQVLQIETRPLIGSAAIVIASAICFTDGARTASAVILLASTLLVVRLIRQRQVWSPVVALTQLAILFSSLFWNSRGEPVFGGDSGISVGSLALNTTGRAALVSENLNSTVNGGVNVWEVTFGQGIGRAREVSLSVAASDTPLNEFIRVSVDLGIIGAMALIGGFGFLFYLSFRLLRSGLATQALQSSLLLIGLVAFSLTENMLSYSWILLPVFVLFGSLNRVLLDHRSNANTCDAENTE